MLAIAAVTAACSGGVATPSAILAATSTARAIATTSSVPSDPATPCTGSCSAGQHRSVRLQPPLRYAVPAGWSSADDGTGEYNLEVGGPSSNNGIYLFRDPLAHSQKPDCPMAADPTVGKSPRELVDWIASLPGLEATPPKAVTVGGLPGFSLDVHAAPSWTHACPYSEGEPVVPLIVGSNPGGDLDWGVGGTGRMRIFVLDAGEGRRLWIDVEATDARTFDELVQRATPVMETFEFTAP